MEYIILVIVGLIGLIFGNKYFNKSNTDSNSVVSFEIM